MKPWVFASLLLATCTVAAEEAPKDTPHAAFDRMQKAKEADDYAAWRAEFAPDTRDSAEDWFDEVMKVGGRSTGEIGELAKAAGVSEDEVRKLSAAQFAEKAFHHHNLGRPKDAERPLYLSASFEKDRHGVETATTEVLDGSSQVLTQSWLKVGGAWKFSGEFTIIPLGGLQDRKAGEICQDWQAAVLAADGKALIATYSSEIQVAYLRTWGPELGRLQEADDKAREAAAKELDVDAGKFASMPVRVYIGTRLSVQIKAWLDKDGHREAVEEMDFSLGKVEKKKASLPFKGDALKAIRLEKDYEWKVTSDCFDEDRPGKK